MFLSNLFILFGFPCVLFDTPVLTFDLSSHFVEQDGIIAAEAEHFHSQTTTDIRKWYIVKCYSKEINPTHLDGSHAKNASGKADVEVLPGTRTSHDDSLINHVNFTNAPGELAVLHHRDWFNTPGKYYVWVRAYSTGTEDNGIHVGIDGTWPESGQRMQWCVGKHQWTWDSEQRTREVHCGEPKLIYLEIAEPGAYTISFSMRKDGFVFDKWVMKRKYNPLVGAGPNELCKPGK